MQAVHVRGERRLAAGGVVHAFGIAALQGSWTRGVAACKARGEPVIVGATATRLPSGSLLGSGLAALLQ